MPVMSNRNILAAIAFVLLSGYASHTHRGPVSRRANSNSAKKTLPTQLVILSTTVDRANNT